MDIAARLRQLRLESEITQAELAECVGTNYQQVQRYENGTSRVSADYLLAFAKCLNVPVSYVFATDENDACAANLTELRFLEKFRCVTPSKKRALMVLLCD